MSKTLLEQAKELLKNIQNDPKALQKFEELVKAHAEKSKHVEMSPEEDKKKRVDELSKRIKACMEKMQKESMDKDDKPHLPGTPEDKAHDVAEEGESVKEAIHGLKDKSEDSKKELLSHLRSLKDKSQLRSPENREAGKESHEKAELEKAKKPSRIEYYEDNQKGIHKPDMANAGLRDRIKSKQVQGKSFAGYLVREGKGEPENIHKEKLAELKAMPNPNLPKTEKSEDYYRNLVKSTLEKAKVDEGKTLGGKIAARQERNIRDVISTKTPSGQKTRTARSSARREQELEEGTHPKSILSSLKGFSERRKGEKIVGKPKTLENLSGRDIRGRSAEERTGVHMHSGSMAGKDLPIGHSAPVFSDKKGKSYPVGGALSGKLGSNIRHEEVMEGLKNIKPNLPKTEKSEDYYRNLVKSTLEKQLMTPPLGMSEKEEMEKARESQPADEIAARELQLFAANDSNLYHSSAKPIIENLARKHAKGVYDHQKAAKLWGYHADRAAKEYTKQFGGDQHTFNPSTRRAVAEKMRDEYLEHVEDRSKELSKPKTEKAEPTKSVHGTPGKNRPLHSRGINEPISVSIPKHDQDAKEKSLAGLKVRRKDISGAKEAHKEILSEIKAQKKPNLPKSEMAKEQVEPTVQPKPKAIMPTAGGSDNGDNRKSKKPVKFIFPKKTQKTEDYYKDLVKTTLEKGDVHDIKTGKKIASSPTEKTPKEAQPIVRNGEKGITTRKELKQKFSPDIMPEEKDVPGGTETKKSN